MADFLLSVGETVARARLRAWQPEASDIQVAPKTCPRCLSSFYITYIIPICLLRETLDETTEHCGYFCGSCGLGSYGARKRKKPGEKS